MNEKGTIRKNQEFTLPVGILEQTESTYLLQKN